MAAAFTDFSALLLPGGHDEAEALNCEAVPKQSKLCFAKQALGL